MSWYSSIEDEVIRRESARHHRDYLTGLEYDVLKTEREALRHPYSVSLQQNRYDYYDRGTRIQCSETVIQQEIEWIGEFIRKKLASQRIHMEQKQILAMLSRISAIYEAAEVKHGQLPEIRLSEFKRDIHKDAA